MPYPILSKSEARLYLQAVESAAEAGKEPPSFPESRQADDGSDEDWESLAEDIAGALTSLAAKIGQSPEVKGSEFEVAAGPIVHSILPEHPALADAEFWVWLTLAHCQTIVDWRYPGKRNLRNFGIGGAGENLLYRLWLRAEIAYSPGRKDEYELSRFGDIDFWRSHIFRQSYGEMRSFARALVEFQFPANNGRKARLKIHDIRELAKGLKRARTNLMFEVMTESRATQFIEWEWKRLTSAAARV